MSRTTCVNAVAFAVAAVAACSTNHPVSPSAGAAGSGAAGTGASGSGVAGRGGSGGMTAPATYIFRPTINRDVDVLFMIDDSSNGTVYQNKLTESFSIYTRLLQTLPGGTPNLHLAVISSSLGAGRETTIDHCPSGGDAGTFHTKPLGKTCATGMLKAGQTFISNVNGQTNYIGDLSDAFSCLSALGSGGCGFEHQLASIARALGADGQPAPAQNAGFLRAGAFLQIVVVSDEDDCSAPPDSALFDQTSMLVSDPLGPLQSYRCNEFGHLCGGQPPPRTPAGPVDLSSTCVSNENGKLLAVGQLVARLKGLKSDPTKVFVAAISAPPTPYVVNLGPAELKNDPSMWPYVQHSCMAGDGTFGDPAVRTKQWVDGFGANGLFQSICADTFEPALQAIGSQLGAALAAPCLPATLDAAKCAFVDHVANAQGTLIDSPLPRCAAASPGPCWNAVANTAQCPNAEGVVFTRPSTSPPPETTTATCQK